MLLGLGATILEAQSTRGNVIVAPRGQPRLGRLVPPPPPPPPEPLTTYGETVFSSYPVILTGDGRILIDLGYGYEQVARTCPYSYGYGCENHEYPAPSYPVPAYSGCPSGYGQTGSYSPCIDPYRLSLSTRQMPSPHPARGAPRPAVGRASQPLRGLVRR